MTVALGYDIAAVRGHFPALSRVVDGRPPAFLDGPAGTQVPVECIDALDHYLRTSNANSHGHFVTSRETDAVAWSAREAAADFLGASDPREVVFGPNMTTLTFSASRAIGRTLRAGDAIVLTRLDHDANVAPWLALAEDRGLEIRWIEVDRDTGTLDLTRLDMLLEGRVRVVALTLASNALGTIVPVSQVARAARAAGALVWVDAVHAAPHVPIDVRALDADFLACSAYKFYGPHLGILWGRIELLGGLPAYKVRPSPAEPPSRLETGTLPYELLAGLVGTFRYLEWLGVSQGGAGGQPGEPDGARAGRLAAALHAIRGYERGLTVRLLDRLSSVRGLRIHGLTDPGRVDERCPTVAFTLASHAPDDVAAFLGDRGIFVWSGDMYAWELARALRVAASSGLVRVGLVHYNTADEIDRLGEALDELTAR